MQISQIIAEIDAEISRLQQARALLSNDEASPRPKAGRPKGSKNKKTAKRKLSAEGRKKIADAMKRRWAERRKETAKK